MENMSLFIQEEYTDLVIEGVSNNSTLDVVKMEFLEAETLSWQELFSGFDSLHAITYSSGISFI